MTDDEAAKRIIADKRAARKTMLESQTPVTISRWDMSDDIFTGSPDILFLTTTVDYQTDGPNADKFSFKGFQGSYLTSQKTMADFLSAETSSTRDIDTSTNVHLSEGPDTFVRMWEYEVEKMPQRVGVGRTTVVHTIDVTPDCYSFITKKLAQIFAVSGDIEARRGAIIVFALPNYGFAIPKSRKIKHHSEIDNSKRLPTYPDAFGTIMMQMNDKGAALNRHHIALQNVTENYTILDSSKFVFNREFQKMYFLTDPETRH